MIQFDSILAWCLFHNSLKDFESLSGKSTTQTFLRHLGQKVPWDLTQAKISGETPLHCILSIYSFSFCFKFGWLCWLDLVGFPKMFVCPSSGIVFSPLGFLLQLEASTSAFTALRSDGVVVSWGAADCGGDCRVMAARFVDSLKLG